MTSAILLIAHGSRRPEANRDLVDLAGIIAATRPDQIVEYAYLELAEPDIPTAASRCVEQGAVEVRMLPYFLSAGAHVRDDLTGFRDQFAEQYPGTEFSVCPPIGLHPRMVEVLLERLNETI